MSQFDTPNLASLGSINNPPFLHIPRLMNIAAEWAAIIPLVCHLASQHHPHQLAGQVALLGRVSVALFPKHGVLAGISRLLSRGPAFFDMVSTLGTTNRKVWDVSWGGNFPCSNGAASCYLADSLLDRKNIMIVPEPVLPLLSASSLTSDTAVPKENTPTGSQPPNGGDISCVPAYPFPRYQTLHVLHFSKVSSKTGWSSKLDRSIHSLPFIAASSLL